VATEVPVGKRKAPEVVTIPLEAQAGVRFSMLAAANKRKAEKLEAKAAASETMKKRRVSYGSRGNKLMPVNELASIGVIGLTQSARGGFKLLPSPISTSLEAVVAAGGDETHLLAAALRQGDRRANTDASLRRARSGRSNRQASLRAKRFRARDAYVPRRQSAGLSNLLQRGLAAAATDADADGGGAALTEPETLSSRGHRWT